MIQPSTLAFTALVLGLAGCADMGSTSLESGTSVAGQACMARVNLNNGSSGGAQVTGSDMSGGASVVNLVDQNGTNWRCETTSDGTVTDLSAIT